MFDVDNISLKILKLISNYISFIRLKKNMFYLFLFLTWFSFVQVLKFYFYISYNGKYSITYMFQKVVFFNFFKKMVSGNGISSSKKFFLVFWWVWTHQSIKLTEKNYILQRTKTNLILQFFAILLFLHTYFK